MAIKRENAVVRKLELIRQRQQTAEQENEGKIKKKLLSCVPTKLGAQAAINIPRPWLNCHRLFQVALFFPPH